MANILRGGFHPADDALMNDVQRFSVASGYTPTNSCPGIAKYEVVKLVTSGTLQIADAADAALILGVVKSVSFIGTDGSRVYGSFIPAGHTFSGDPNIYNPLAPIVEVWTNPLMAFWACAAAGTTTALATAGLGANMDLSATSATSVSTTGPRESLRTLDGTFTGSVKQFRVIDILIGGRDPLNDVTSANYRLKVMMNKAALPVFDSGGI